MRLAAAFPRTTTPLLFAPLLLEHRGVRVFRVYRRGNPRDVFQCFWYRTAQEPCFECHPTDFDVREFPGDLVEQFGLNDLWCPMVDRARAIVVAIERGVVTKDGGPRGPGIVPYPAALPGIDEEEPF